MACAVALVLALCASPAWSAAHVQTANNSVAAQTVSVTLTLTAGNAVYVTLLTFGASSWTQTAGDTLTLALASSASTRQYYACSVAGGATTFTFDVGVADFPTLFVSEFSGSQASCLDQTVDGGTGTATTHSTGTTAATSQAAEVLMASLHNTGADTSGLSVSNGFTIPANGNLVTSSGGERGAVAYKIVAATGTYETTFTTTDSRSGAAVLATYKVSGSSTAACVIGGGIIRAGCPN